MNDAVRAVDAITKAIAQECRILGLEAPKKLEIAETPLQQAKELPWAERLARIVELNQNLGLDDLMNN